MAQKDMTETHPVTLEEMLALVVVGADDLVEHLPERHRRYVLALAAERGSSVRDAVAELVERHSVASARVGQ